MNILLSPHNDDETLFACYTLLRYRPHVIVCLRSARMGTPGYPPPLIDHETREAETEAAMNVLGLEWTQWPWTDAGDQWQQVGSALETLSHLPRIERVFAPAFEDGGHVQHNTIARMAGRVFGKRVTYYLTYTNGTLRSTSGSAVDPDPDWPVLKRQALDCYQSQIAHPMTGHHFSAPLDEFYAI